MTDTLLRFRSSGRLLLSEYAQIVVAVGLLSAGIAYWAVHGDRVPQALLFFLLFVYAPVRLAIPVLRWWTVVYTVDADTLSIESGIVRRRSRRLRWESVATLDEQVGIVFRILGLRRLRLTQTTSDDGVFVLRAVTADVAANVRARVVITSRDRIDAPEQRPDSGVIYTATRRQLALMSIVYGQFAVVAPAILVPIGGFLEEIGIRTWLLELVSSLPLPIVAAACVLVVFAIGVTGTVLKYHGFTVRARSSGALVLTYGLVEQRERVIDPRSIEGIRLKRSLVEQLLGRSRLAVMAFHSSDDVGASVLLPSLPDHIVRRIVREHFAAFVGTGPILPERAPSSWGRMTAFVAIWAVPAFCAVALIGRGVEVAWAAVGAAVALGVVTMLARPIVSRLSLVGDAIVLHRRVLVTEHEVYVRVGACHWTHAIYAGRRSSPLLLSLHVYAGGARSFRAARSEPGVGAAVSYALRSRRRPAAIRQGASPEGVKT